MLVQIVLCVQLGICRFRDCYMMSAYLHHVFTMCLHVQWQDFGILRRWHAHFMYVFTRIPKEKDYIEHNTWTSCAGAKRRQKRAKTAIWELTHVSRGKPPRKRISGSLTTNYTAGAIRSARIVAAVQLRDGAAASNSFAPCNRIEKTTYRDTRSRRNLTSERDLEGELARRDPSSPLRRLWRPRHQSPSPLAASSSSSSSFPQSFPFILL